MVRTLNFLKIVFVKLCFRFHKISNRYFKENLGFIIGDQNLDRIKYADDTILIAYMERKRQKLSHSSKWKSEITESKSTVI